MVLSELYFLLLFRGKKEKSFEHMLFTLSKGFNNFSPFFTARQHGQIFLNKSEQSKHSFSFRCFAISVFFFFFLDQ